VPVSPTCVCLSCPTHGESPGLVGSYPVYPSSTTDAQWRLVEPLLPPAGNTGGKGGRTEKHPRRLVLDAIFYLVSGGIAWRALPREFPPWQTVYSTFRRWTETGAWQRVHDMLRDRVRVRAGRKATPTAAVIDSQSVRGADTVPDHHDVTATRPQTPMTTVFKHSLTARPARGRWRGADRRSW
jgi:transposase